MDERLLADNIAKLLERVRLAAEKSQRAAGDIRVLAVSKTHPAEAIRAAHRHGLDHFGESYLQEALAKIAALAELPVTWHFIGPIQSNKTRSIAEHFAWVHSVDRGRIARRLSDQRPGDLPPLQVCLQVNISGEQSKSGVDPQDLPRLAAEVLELPRLRLRGLMAIPAPTGDPAQQRAAFSRLRGQLAQLSALAPDLDTLSMGMSDDLEAAIAEGATIVRVGSGIFGSRNR
ncbi:MAG: YggS family pyridoxal phosphate-dependent enzyme [Pseudomonadales bacterium]|nr:YggS family pyridoxal phosphate-dependent enzyme [Halioglobus sp.]MCP5121312.1 YggS family pyridoxal phosphate-dependent enzyme [Pseudomonadales bacterium]MCP5193348.1 YggS family pyridoxal phosphate-dependent enzyme [Pseudomonadales bacterium]